MRLPVSALRLPFVLLGMISLGACRAALSPSSTEDAATCPMHARLVPASLPVQETDRGQDAWLNAWDADTARRLAMKLSMTTIRLSLCLLAALTLGACATGTVESGGTVHPTVTYVYDRTSADLKKVTRDAEGYCAGRGYDTAHLLRIKPQDATEADAVFECL